MKEARITELARSDLDRIWDYIAQNNPAAADRLVDQIVANCFKLASNPSLGRSRLQYIEGLRSHRVRNYLIFYFPITEGVEIARVLHGARDLPRMF